MKPRLIVLAGVGALAWCMLPAPARAQSSQAPDALPSVRTIKATGRPIPEALDQIEGRYGVALDYSDPVYADPADVQILRLFRGRALRTPVPVPKVRTLEFQYFEEGGTPPGVPYIACDLATLGCAPVTVKPVGGMTSLLQQLADEFANQGGPIFGVRKLQGLTGPQWEVYPEEARNKSGAWVAQTDFLGATIYIPTEERGAGVMLQLIAQQLTERWGRKFVASTDWIRPFSTRARYGAEDITARQALIEVLGGFKPPFVWRMYYGPEDGSYVINVVGLPYREPPRPQPPAALLPPAPMPTSYWLQRAQTPGGTRQIQQVLAKLGYLRTAPTTEWDAKSAAALRGFQAASGIPTTGVLDVPTLMKLEPHMPLVRFRLSPAQVKEQYLTALNYWLGTTPDGVKELQEALAKAGYYSGPVTGEWDAKTLAAMKAFRKANGPSTTERLLPLLPKTQAR